MENLILAVMRFLAILILASYASYLISYLAG
jgi:hypothetical protein